MTHIFVSKLTIIGSDNGLSPERRQAIIGTNAGILLIWIWGTNLNLKRNAYIFSQANALENVVCEIAAILSEPQCVETLTMRGPSYSKSTQHYLCCCCPVSLRHQDISTHEFDYVELLRSYISWGRVSTTCVMSLWRNDINCSYNLIFTMKKLAGQE